MPEDTRGFGQRVIAFVAIADQIHLTGWQYFFCWEQEVYRDLAASRVGILIPDHRLIRRATTIDPHIG
jgi:hypothetical protein